MHCIAFSFVEGIWIVLILEHIWRRSPVSLRFHLVLTYGVFVPHIWDHVSSLIFWGESQIKDFCPFFFFFPLLVLDSTELIFAHFSNLDHQRWSDEGKFYDERLRSLGLFSWKKGRLRENFFVVYSFLSRKRGMGTDLSGDQL